MRIPERLRTATRHATRWHVRSHETARLNALMASTALTQRRRELVEVEEFLVLHQRQYDARERRAGSRTRIPQEVALGELATG